MPAAWLRLRPARNPGAGKYFFIAIGLDDRARWILGPDSVVLAPETLAAFPASTARLATRESDSEARFLLWRYQMNAMRAVRLALGQTQPGPAPAPSSTRPLRNPDSDFSGHSSGKAAVAFLEGHTGRADFATRISVATAVAKLGAGSVRGRPRPRAVLQRVLHSPTLHLCRPGGPGRAGPGRSSPP